MLKKIALALFSVIWFINPANAQVTGLSGWNIFLDPGHSQHENMGIYGYSEAEKNLRVGLRLLELLNNLTDIDTVYISRTNDEEYVTLSQRTDHANAVGAAWYHSIHSDAGAPNYNSTLLLWGQLYDGTPDPPVGGEDMSAIIVDILTRGMRIGTRGSIGDCSFYNSCSSSWPGPYLWVNRMTNMPSELSEAGFHTSPVQNTRNMNYQWKKLEAYTFFWSFLQYHNIDRPFVGICTGYITDTETGIPLNGATVELNGQTYTTDTFQSLFHNYTNDPDLLHNGFYFIENLPDDTLMMTVSAEGYYPETLYVHICDTFFTFKDVNLLSSVPPHVLSSSPAQGDTSFPAWDNIIIDFSRKMNAASVETAFSISPEASGSISWENGMKRLRFTPDTLQFESDYSITISGTATDQYGHPLDGNGDGEGGDDFTLNFRTGPPDMFPPDLVSIYPPANAENVELKPLIRVEYDELLNPETISDQIFKLERTYNQETIPALIQTYDVNHRSVVCLFPSEELISLEDYRIKIFPGLEDLFGNQVITGRIFNFTTGSGRWEPTGIDALEANLLSNWWAPQQSGSTTGIITDSTYRDLNNEIVNLLTNSQSSMEVRYGWDLQASSWLIRIYLADGSVPKNIHFTPKTMQVYLFGDGSGNKFRFCVDDNVPNYSAANHEVSPWFTIDWIGWKLISWDMPADGTGEWIGDGNLDGTLGFDSFQFTYTPGSPSTGTIYLDDLRISELEPVNIHTEITQLPRKPHLLPNYPNPFNPSTRISFYLPSQEKIYLELYNLKGEKVRTLCSGLFDQGKHSVELDASSLPSGVYFVKLSTNSGGFSRKITLLK